MFQAAADSLQTKLTTSLLCNGYPNISFVYVFKQSRGSSGTGTLRVQTECDGTPINNGQSCTIRLRTGSNVLNFHATTGKYLPKCAVWQEQKVCGIETFLFT